MEKILIDKRQLKWYTLPGHLNKNMDPKKLVADFFDQFPKIEGQEAADATPAYYYVGYINLENKNGARMQMFIEVGLGLDQPIWEVTTLLATNEEGSIDSYKCAQVEEMSMQYFTREQDASSYARTAILSTQYEFI